MLKTSTISLKNFFESAYRKTTLTEDRKKILSKIAAEITKEYKINNTVNLTFICTHNSRRSQLGQVWSFFAANYFNLKINAFSGGTEVTAFYRNTIKTLQKVGFDFLLTDFSHENPTYKISFNGTENTILGFSKLYSNPINIEPFMAITTCDNADMNCPFIPTASHRFHLPFVDPKHSDGTAQQEETYLQTSIQIAGEVYFIFSEFKKLV
jgi:arsenate reductase